MFHRTSTSKKIFNYVDYRIFCELKHWMQRRHPARTSMVLQEVLHQVGNRSYVLQGTYLDRRGKPDIDPVSQCEGRANQASRQNQSRSQSLRSELGELL